MFEYSDRRPTLAETIERSLKADYIFALGENPITKEVIDSASSLRMIASMEIFPTQIDLSAATERGIPVSGLPHDEEITETTAEYTVALLLAVAWGIPRADAFLRRGDWVQYQTTGLPARRLRGTRIGIVGLGKVGRGVARRVQAFDLEVAYHDLKRDHDAEEALGLRWEPLDRLLAESDFIVICVVLTNDTLDLFDDALFSSLKQGSVLINTSRGKVLDENALGAALESGKVSAAGLDVYRREIPEPNPGPVSRLLDFEQVVLTPHVGTSAIETREWMAQHVVECIARDMRGERPWPVLNPEVYGEPSMATSRIG